ncbi:MAG: 5-formyltetrahydrofolate cyclo-ligase [Phycisphaerae bacterium]
MKRSIRKEMRARLAAMPADLAASKSRAACQRLIALKEFQDAATVMLYMNMPEEVDTTQAVLAAWDAEKTVLAPKVSWEHRHMEALEVRSLEAGLVTSEQGIREPQYGEPWPVESIDLIVLPALAFDRRGHRLGRGLGFYDRFLANPRIRAFRCGLAFAEQVVDELPITQNDQPVDALVTDVEALRFDRQK